MEKHTLHIVTGAPCAGKTAALHALLGMKTDYIAFDIDWLAQPASDLAGKSIYFDSSTWPSYGNMWLEVLHAIYKNGKVPVFFAPIDKKDVASYGPTDWCEKVEWLLLDCPDEVRTARMNSRAWDSVRQREALADAAALRKEIHHTLDTSKHSPEDIAKAITTWLDEAK